MKLVFLLILWLTCTVHQSRAEPFLFEAISDGAHFAGSLAEGAFQAAHGVAHVAVDVAGGVIGAGVDLFSNLEKDVKSLRNSIAESENDIRSKLLGRALQRAQATLQQIQDASREISQATADAGKKIRTDIADLKSTQQAKVRAVTEEARKKLSTSSKEAQEKGQALLRHFSNESSKDLNKCISEVVARFTKLQATANAVARQFQEPLNTLAAQVEKCTKLSAANTRSMGLVRCAIETRKALRPLEAAQMKFSSEKAHIARAGQQHLLWSTCVLRALAKLHIEADSVGEKTEQLLMEYKEKNVPKSQPNTPATTAPTETAPAKTAPTETPRAKTAPVETSPARTAPAETSTAKNAPAETCPVRTAPAETSPAPA